MLGPLKPSVRHSSKAPSSRAPSLAVLPGRATARFAFGSTTKSSPTSAVPLKIGQSVLAIDAFGHPSLQGLGDKCAPSIQSRFCQETAAASLRCLSLQRQSSHALVRGHDVANKVQCAWPVA
ncbi:hypothetical protein EMPS_02349 [Entomortierella parvispora]|uniref:Uncharacterized protein n=1 Tax=Entomortierella parvispora TaxID=205924 RepID=A0A9P3LTV0_9FUNG|nr:hypothetical protein EMPS_02349 [Entomortierella parvispora]